MLLTHLLWSRRSRVSLVTGGLHSSHREPEGPGLLSSRDQPRRLHRHRSGRSTGHRAHGELGKTIRPGGIRRNRDARGAPAHEKRTRSRSSAPAIGPARSSTSAEPSTAARRSRARSHTTATSHSTATTRSIEKKAYQGAGIPRSGTVVAAIVSHTATKFSASAPPQSRWSRHWSAHHAMSGSSHTELWTVKDLPVTSTIPT